MLGKEEYEKHFRPLLECSKEEAVAILLADLKLSHELEAKTNQELADEMVKVWAQLPINSPVALLVSEVIERLQNVKSS
jgi:hypothetical protein